MSSLEIKEDTMVLLAESTPNIPDTDSGNAGVGICGIKPTLNGGVRTQPDQVTKKTPSQPRLSAEILGATDLQRSVKGGFRSLVSRFSNAPHIGPYIKDGYNQQEKRHRTDKSNSHDLAH